MFRITLEKDSYIGWNGERVPARVQVKEFEDHGEAVSWFVYDSYFSEPYTRRAVWERVDD